MPPATAGLSQSPVDPSCSSHMWLALAQIDWLITVLLWWAGSGREWSWRITAGVIHAHTTSHEALAEVPIALMSRHWVRMLARRCDCCRRHPARRPRRASAALPAPLPASLCLRLSLAGGHEPGADYPRRHISWSAGSTLYPTSVHHSALALKPDTKASVPRACNHLPSSSMQTLLGPEPYPSHMTRGQSPYCLTEAWP